MLLYRLADLMESSLDELAALETLDNGKPIGDSRAADLPLAIDCIQVLRRLGGQDSRRHDSGARRLFLLHAPRTRRRLWADHSLELSDSDGSMEMGTCSGNRQHHRHEASRTNAVDVFATGRTGFGSGLPAWCHQHRARIRTDGWRCHREASRWSIKLRSRALSKQVSESWRTPH